jgi:hypothetical protein
MKRHLLKHVRLILAEARIACRAQGVSCYLEVGGRRPKLVLERDGRRRIKPLCSTPHCVDAAINLARQDLKRLLADFASPSPTQRSMR